MLISVDKAAQAAWMLRAGALRRIWARLRELSHDLCTKAGRLSVRPGGPALQRGSVQASGEQARPEQTPREQSAREQSASAPTTATQIDLAELAEAADSGDGTAL